MYWENDMDKYEGIAKIQISTSCRWIEMAVEQKNPRLRIDLACSFPLTYHMIDRELLNRTNLN